MDEHTMVFRCDPIGHWLFHSRLKDFTHNACYYQLFANIFRHNANERIISDLITVEFLCLVKPCLPFNIYGFDKRHGYTHSNHCCFSAHWRPEIPSKATWCSDVQVLSKNPLFSSTCLSFSPGWHSPLLQSIISDQPLAEMWPFPTFKSVKVSPK